MRIVNLIHIGDQVLSLDDMDPMKKDVYKRQQVLYSEAECPGDGGQRL